MHTLTTTRRLAGLAALMIMAGAAQAQAWRLDPSHPRPRFTVGTGAASNCVTDNLTGLVWLRNPDPTPRDLEAASSYCRGLGGGDGRGGHADWRVPTAAELAGLVECKYRDPALPNTEGTGPWSENDPFIGIRRGFYWSATVMYGTTTASTHEVYGLQTGVVNGKHVKESCFVLPVRGQDQRNKK